MLITIISFAFVFTIITLVHEFGHLCVAKMNGIAVPEFGVGFGPNLYSFSYHETTYKINLLPLLGYVKIAGLDADEADDKIISEKNKYYTKKVWQKFLPIVAGALMNILLGALVFCFVFLLAGIPSGVSNEIAAISPGSEAARIGLKAGDKLLSLDNKPINDPLEAVKYIHQNPGKQLKLGILRQDKKLTFVATPTLNTKQKIGLIGFQLKTLSKKVGLLSALYHGFAGAANLCLAILLIVGQLIVGQVSLFDLAGPVGIAQITGQYAQGGAFSLLNFLAFFSINVGVLNLLPIPALDGGRIVFIIIEAFRGKALDIQKENQFHAVGLTLLLALMAILTVNDLLRLFR
jgi:regulator of sigma E protease